MKKNNYFVYFILLSLFSYMFLQNNTLLTSPKVIKKIRSSSSPKASVKMKKARYEYFNRMLRDPKTKLIPKGIRQKELDFVEKLNKKNELLNKQSFVNELDWKEAGPGNVGGRTRGLAVDITDPNTIIAGGASGGIWKSIDKGSTWTMKSTHDQLLSVSTLVQDPREGNTNTWYYGTGERIGSPPDNVRTHIFSGNGIYKSTDNGESWNILPSTFSNNFTIWDSPFDYVDKIRINPITGSLFVCNYGIGIVKSVDGGNTFTQLLGGTGEHEFSDISIADDGRIVVVMSSPLAGGSPKKTPGVYKSFDDGNTWTNITPSTFPQTFSRSLIEIAPSNTDIAYVVTLVKNNGTAQAEDIRFHKINISNGSSEDRSDNLPEFDMTVASFKMNIATQGGYNLSLAIKPNDENYVLIGATSLFRSANGFETKPNNPKMDWIGGYHPDYFGYPNFHPDIHANFFEPNNPEAVWWGHDGGLSYTSDISNTNFKDVFPWENKNNGYNVTQFFHVSIPQNAGDNRIMGGTQDNGTPLLVSNGTIGNQIEDVSSGDGSYSYFGNKFAFSSSQDGIVNRLRYDEQNYPRLQGAYSQIYPTGASNQLFINPFAVDPSDEEIMFYPAGNSLWRNNQLSTIPDYQSGTTVGWTELNDLSLPTGYIISVVAVSKNNPSHRLYYGGIDFSQQSTGASKLFRLDNANTVTSGAIDISIPGTTPFSFINNIIVNPENADELIVVFSNYNIIGVYHSIDAGQTFAQIEGNLVGDDNSPGPSIKSAAILPTKNGTQYFLATSIGVFSTMNIAGNNTNWVQEGKNTIGNVIVNSLASRTSDAKIVAGTHGRGAFVTYGEAKSNMAIASVDVNSLTLQLQPGQSKSTNFVISNTGGATLNYNISVTGTFSGSLSKLGKNKYTLNKNEFSIKEHASLREKIKISNVIGDDNSKVLTSEDKHINDMSKIVGNDYLTNDDGNLTSDTFLGFGDNGSGGSSVFSWMNQFNLTDKDFVLDSFDFFMNTDNASSNSTYLEIMDANLNTIDFGTLDLTLAPQGDWYNITLSPTISLKAGSTFYILIKSDNNIPFPAGVDYNSINPNQGFFLSDSLYKNLNTVTGFEKGAFLIRASGTFGASVGTNKNPEAVANISKNQAEINETITFDASQSSDNDGQIAGYLWNFGDGTTSSSESATHAYTQSDTYTYSLTVTDNQGATGQTTGQIIVGASSNIYVTVDPINGSIASGGSQNISLLLDATNLAMGTYTGQVNITTNGGNIIIPIDYLVDIEKISTIPTDYSLSQNYPNPFNPSTVIEFSIPKTSDVSLIIYDVLGKEITNLVNESKSAGVYKVNFDASKLSSGIYFYNLETEDFSLAKKMLLVK